MESSPKPEHLVSDKLKIEIMTAALRRLACLGSGHHLGNSEGNLIAQKALVKAGVDMVSDEPPTFTASVSIHTPIPVMNDG